MRERAPACETLAGFPVRDSEGKGGPGISRDPLAESGPGFAALAALDAWIAQALEALRAEAQVLVGEFWVRATQERRLRPRSEAGRLGVRARRLTSRSAPAGAFVIEWYQVVWVRQAGKPKPISRYIPKGSGDRYREAAFRRLAQPWELALVEDLEPRFARLRALARSLGRLRLQAKLHARLMARLAPPELDRS